MSITMSITISFDTRLALASALASQVRAVLSGPSATCVLSATSSDRAEVVVLDGEASRYVVTRELFEQAASVLASNAQAESRAESRAVLNWSGATGGLRSTSSNRAEAGASDDEASTLEQPQADASSRHGVPLVGRMVYVG